ncbi:hypothetical protein BOX15_Mlig009611g3 [Macrostomum lignano]|uniref:AB hydrolase-1 domain-containing protein n=3 Tax=Macrostomum lignano TaxID=282301 RepID=A0A1I8GZH5_9PLAT|nr:hypothetical protein BOX15_Mlig009611g3 [Macrostomum lignano]
MLLQAAAPIAIQLRRHLTCTVLGRPIYYEQVGTGPRRVLLLPGALGSCATDFQPQLKGLNREKYTVVCWDPPGYGHSRPPERDWSEKGGEFLHSDAEHALSLMKQLGLAPFAAVGWSDGGNTAMLTALLGSPSTVDRLVLFGCNSYVSPEDVKRTEAIRDLSKWSDRMRGPFEAVYGPDRFRSLWEEWCKAYLGYPNGGDICSQRLAEIRVPTLVVHGAGDPVVDPIHHKFLHSNIAGSRLVVWQDAKHNLHLRHPDRFNKLLEEFLDE